VRAAERKDKRSSEPRYEGLRVEGVNFPGHFLLRMPTVPIRPAVSGEELLIVDPFHGDALLDLDDCELLFHQQVGDGELDGRAFEPATRSQMVVRTLANLKRLYVRMRSFRPARLVSELLLAIEPGSISELRDRGLLAYHLDDFASALSRSRVVLSPESGAGRQSRGECERRTADSRAGSHAPAARRWTQLNRGRLPTTQWKGFEPSLSPKCFPIV
jgi:transglutaminase superfamily protein/tetratricopeptide repeat protein